MPAVPMPSAEVDLDEALVRQLLAAQHPDLADRPLRLVANGWDNAVFRLGDDLAVRLPRRADAAELVRHEQRWLPELAPRLPLPVPVPRRVGTPTGGYPWHWSVVPWLEGDIALDTPPADLEHTAARLGDFVAELQQPAPAHAPANPYRGVPLAARADLLDRHLAALDGVVDVERVRAAWAACAAAPVWDEAPRWLHGDLHPANLLVVGGRLAGVIDFGDLTAGDPASDLAVAWMLLPPGPRATFRRHAGAHRPVDDALWQRARGWALALGVAIAANTADHPAFHDLGLGTIAAALAN